MRERVAGNKDAAPVPDGVGEATMMQIPGDGWQGLTMVLTILIALVCAWRAER